MNPAPLDPIFRDLPLSASPAAMTDTYPLTTSPLSVWLGPDTFATVDVPTGSNPVVAIWYTLAGRQVATIAAGTSKKVCPTDGVLALVATTGTASASVSAERIGSGKMTPVAPLVEPSVAHLRSASFTRPSDTTAYAVGDLIANSTTAGSVTVPSLAPPTSNPAGGSGHIRRVLVRKSNATGNLDVRIHFYTSAPTPANGDNGAWSTSGSATYRGSVSVAIRTLFTDGGVGIGVPDAGFEIPVLAGQTLFWVAAARSTYTPAFGEVITLEAEVSQ